MGYYVEGLGTFDNEPLVTTDENGNRVVQSAGLVRKGTLNSSGGLSRSGGDRMVAAYDKLKSSTRNALENWNVSRAGNANQRRAAMDKLFNAYRSDGTYKGSREDFDRWFAARNQEMESSALTWTGSFRGNPTAAADGTPIGTRNINGQRMKFNGFGWNAV